jgi:nitroreductase
MSTRCTAGTTGHDPIPFDVVPDLIRTAGRAPSVHNTQPWQFIRTDDGALELRADPTRQLRAVDPEGRELFISCGAALFGLRLAIRGLDREPTVALFPEPGDPLLLARVALGPAVALRSPEQRMLSALRRRHTHRDPFDQQALPPELLAALQRSTEIEHAELVLLHGPADRQRLAALVAAAERSHHQQPALLADLARWTRPPGSPARDGVSAMSYPRRPRQSAIADLPGRDFALGRHWGFLPSPGETSLEPAAPTVAVLATAGDRPVDWLNAGQALHRMTLLAATQWVFASLHTQPLEMTSLRAAVRLELHLEGYPQMLLRLGHAGTAAPTSRREFTEVLTLDASVAGSTEPEAGRSVCSGSAAHDPHC